MADVAKTLVKLDPLGKSHVDVHHLVAVGRRNNCQRLPPDEAGGNRRPLVITETSGPRATLLTLDTFLDSFSHLPLIIQHRQPHTSNGEQKKVVDEIAR